jgi:hypothetical protein
MNLKVQPGGSHKQAGKTRRSLSLSPADLRRYRTPENSNHGLSTRCLRDAQLVNSRTTLFAPPILIAAWTANTVHRWSYAAANPAYRHRGRPLFYYY